MTIGPLLTLAVESAQLKFKLNQNHPVENRRAVADRLEALARADAGDVARLMRERMPDRMPNT